MNRAILFCSKTLIRKRSEIYDFGIFFPILAILEEVKMHVFCDNTWILRLKINNISHMLMNAWFRKDTNSKFYLKLCKAWIEH